MRGLFRSVMGNKEALYFPTNVKIGTEGSGIVVGVVMPDVKDAVLWADIA